MKEFYLANETATLNLGKLLAESSPLEGCIFLTGELGLGKTTLARGFIAGLGFQGIIKSPTYTLVESYNMQQKVIHHFDLYRLHTPEELEFIGISDFFNKNTLCLIEWPERAGIILPPADIHCYLNEMNEGRKVILEAHTLVGNNWLEAINLR